MSREERLKMWRNEGDQFWLAEKQVVCSHCGGTAFEERSDILPTRGLALIELNWLNMGATLLICEHCGHIEWFAYTGRA